MSIFLKSETVIYFAYQIKRFSNLTKIVFLHYEWYK